LKLKNIILEVKLSNKFRNGHEKFRGCKGVHGFETSCLDISGGSRFFMSIFEFIGQFFFQNDVFKLQEVFSDLGIKVMLEDELGSFQAFLILKN
jgi:hypothetical protein